VVERLRECVPGPFRIAFGPEEGEDAVAAHPRLAGGGEDGVEREQAALRGGAAEGDPVRPGSVDCAKCPEDNAFRHLRSV
jgi:hypothetical protein